MQYDRVSERAAAALARSQQQSFEYQYVIKCFEPENAACACMHVGQTCSISSNGGDGANKLDRLAGALCCNDRDSSTAAAALGVTTAHATQNSVTTALSTQNSPVALSPLPIGKSDKLATGQTTSQTKGILQDAGVEADLHDTSQTQSNEQKGSMWQTLQLRLNFQSQSPRLTPEQHCDSWLCRYNGCLDKAKDFPVSKASGGSRSRSSRSNRQNSSPITFPAGQSSPTQRGPALGAQQTAAAATAPATALQPVKWDTECIRFGQAVAGNEVVSPQPPSKSSPNSFVLKASNSNNRVSSSISTPSQLATTCNCDEVSYQTTVESINLTQCKQALSDAQAQLYLLHAQQASAAQQLVVLLCDQVQLRQQQLAALAALLQAELAAARGQCDGQEAGPMLSPGRNRICASNYDTAGEAAQLLQHCTTKLSTSAAALLASYRLSIGSSRTGSGSSRHGDDGAHGSLDSSSNSDWRRLCSSFPPSFFDSHQRLMAVEQRAQEAVLLGRSALRLLRSHPTRQHDSISQITEIGRNTSSGSTNTVGSSLPSRPAGAALGAEQQQTLTSRPAAAALPEQLEVAHFTAGSTACYDDAANRVPGLDWIKALPSNICQEDSPLLVAAECCSICLGSFVAGEELTVLPCLHQHHAQCLRVWLSIKASCPLCVMAVGPDGGGSAIVPLVVL